MGLGITRLSMVCAICDATGDDSDDAVVKIRRLINLSGPSFCNITNWPFLHTNISFNITSAGGNAYSGSGYLPATFKKVVGAFIQTTSGSNNERYPLTEVGISEAYRWANPSNNNFIPDEFCITRESGGFWKIEFNRTPDQNYTVYMEIEVQWTDLTGDTDETVMPKDYYGEFTHFCKIDRLLQQGDSENYQIAKKDWWDPDNPKCKLKVLLGKLSSPLKKKSVIMDPNYTQPFTGRRRQDYNKPNSNA